MIINFLLIANYIIASLVALVIILVIGGTILGFIKNTAATEETHIVTVASKRYIRRFNRYRGWIVYCYVAFELECFRQKELEVPTYVYDALYEGQRGELTFQGKKYISFDIRNVSQRSK